MATAQFNTAGKTPQELGKELVAELGKGPWGANKDKANALIDAGASLSETDAEGRTPLMLAILADAKDVALKIVDKDTNLDAQDTKRKNTALLLVLAPVSPSDEMDSDSNIEIANALLKKGASVAPVNTSGETALIMVGKTGNFRLTQEVLARKPDLDARDWTKTSALEYAQRGPFGPGKAAELIEYAMQQRDEAAKVARELQVQAEMRTEMENITAAVKQGTRGPMKAPLVASFGPRPKTTNS